MKILLLSVFSVFFIGFIEYVYAQIPIPIPFVDDQVTIEYIGILILFLTFIVPSIIITYKKSKKNSNKHPQTKLTDSKFQPDVKHICSKCGFETDDKDTFEMHHRDEENICIKSWVGRKYYGGKWFDKDEKIPESESTFLESTDTSKHVEKEPKKKQTLFCTNCGNPLNISSKFCGACGNPIKPLEDK